MFQLHWVKEVIEILNVFIGKSLLFKVLCDMFFVSLGVSSACARFHAMPD